MYCKNNCTIQAKVDIPSKYFIRHFANSYNCSVAEISGAIIRKFILEYGQGSNEYVLLKDFIIKNQNIKE